MNEMIRELEEKAAKYESEMHKQEEQYRKRDNERLKQFFYTNRFDDLADNLSKSRPASSQLRH